MTRAIVLTPQMTGADGVSEMTRQVVAALEAQAGETLTSLEVWSLADDAPPSDLRGSTTFRTARGSRMTFAGFGLRPGGAVGADTLVLALHAHLLPVTLPLLRAGARLVPVLLGIESWKPLRRLERAAIRRAWRVAAISRHTAGRFRAANPDFASLDIRVCHPGVSPLRTDAAREGRVTDVASATALSRSCALIVGRMASAERYKGHDELLAVWPRVREAVPGATLVVAGGGDDVPRLIEKARALGIEPAVRFEGTVSAERLAMLYRDAAVFVMPSANEGFGIVYVEAMRAGTPCVAASGAAEEIVEHGVSGLIVRPGDHDALARAIVELLSDGDSRTRMGREAARAANRFTPESFAARLYDLLDLPVPVAAC